MEIASYFSIDPIVNENYFVENKNGLDFMKGDKELDFSIKIGEASKNLRRKNQAFIVSNSNVPTTYNEIKKLSDIPGLKTFDINNLLAYQTNSLVGSTDKYEIITLLNGSLNFDLVKFLMQ
ncbi:hypothetical protein LFYK43_10070 [Ligilactobacillus salitolerans]|uniref:Uncharacterized protein n=1 Tax=Ligilactobacillus salitolerans TaxID=1808352 RepID=A0A401ISP2_9LACO|nr:hypothetical protein [Ligilactobacillus salitolerans]GBG94548.1 hypothetical protein LFYK43_10070 [Ligilactobacillus salitolerans]